MTWILNSPRLTSSNTVTVTRVIDISYQLVITWGLPVGQLLDFLLFPFMSFDWDLFFRLFEPDIIGILDTVFRWLHSIPS